MNIYFLNEDYRSECIDFQQCAACPRDVTRRDLSRGFSLVELLIAMAVGLIILGAMYGLFTIQNKHLGNQEVIAEMQQNARIAMDMVSREVRMAGYNPSGTLTGCTGTTPTATCVGIRTASANLISFSTDLNGNGSLTADSANPNENIVYYRYLSSNVPTLGRISNNSFLQPVVGYLDLLSFSYYYLQPDGSVTTNNTGLANIREVEITIRTIASKMDPAYPTNGGYRTYTLTSRVAPRNLAF